MLGATSAGSSRRSRTPTWAPLNVTWGNARIT